MRNGPNVVVSLCSDARRERTNRRKHGKTSVEKHSSETLEFPFFTQQPPPLSASHGGCPTAALVLNI